MDLPPCLPSASAYAEAEIRDEPFITVVAAYVTFAEELSRKGCEVCGNPGKLMTDGWIRTRCEIHEVET